MYPSVGVGRVGNRNGEGILVLIPDVGGDIQAESSDSGDPESRNYRVNINNSFSNDAFNHIVEFNVLS